MVLITSLEESHNFRRQKRCPNPPAHWTFSLQTPKFLRKYACLCPEQVRNCDMSAKAVSKPAISCSRQNILEGTIPCRAPSTGVAPREIFWWLGILCGKCLTMPITRMSFYPHSFRGLWKYPGGAQATGEEINWQNNKFWQDINRTLTWQ